MQFHETVLLFRYAKFLIDHLKNNMKLVKPLHKAKQKPKIIKYNQHGLNFEQI